VVGAKVASRFGISPIVIGLTVVSIGTSMPELAVSVVAAVEGNGALAVGNIAGTNVVNLVLVLVLVLGPSALLLPLALEVCSRDSTAPCWLPARWSTPLRSSTRRDGRAATRRPNSSRPEAVSQRTALRVGMTLAGIAIIVIGAEP